MRSERSGIFKKNVVYVWRKSLGIIGESTEHF